MDIKEINNVDTDNTSTKSLDVTNYNPSDELDVGENNYDYGESFYAKKKRATIVSKVVSTTLIIGASGVLAGSLILGAVSSPKVSVPTYKKEITNVLKMNYIVENQTDYSVHFLIFEGKNEVYRLDSTETKEYTFVVDILKLDTEYNAKMVSGPYNNRTEIKGTYFTFTLHE